MLSEGAGVSGTVDSVDEVTASPKATCELRTTREIVRATSAVSKMERSVIDPPWSENNFLYPNTENIVKKTGSSNAPDEETHSRPLKTTSMSLGSDVTTVTCLQTLLLAAGILVVIAETADQFVCSDAGAPLSSQLLLQKPYLLAQDTHVAVRVNCLQRDGPPCAFGR